MLTNKISLSDIWKKLAPAEKDHYLGWRLASIMVAGSILFAGIITAGFVYQNIYSTLSNTYSIFVLSSELGMDIVDMDSYKKTADIIANKKIPASIPAEIRNIFDYQIDLEPATPTTTKPIKL